MKLGIIAAMQSEAEKIIAAMTDVTVEAVGGINYTSGKLNGTDAVCAVCGIGKVFAAMCAEAMIIKYAPDYIINSGIAGTLTSRLGIGDAAIATDAVQHDMDTSAIGDPVGLISGINVIKLPLSDMLGGKIETIARELGLNTVRGTIATGDQFIGDGEKKKKIVMTFGAIACEMEGGAVAQVCYVNAVPCAVIRVISDSADGQAVEDYPAFAKKSAELSAEISIRLAGELCRAD